MHYNREKLLDLMDGIGNPRNEITQRDLIMMCARWMSDDDIGRMLYANEINVNSNVFVEDIPDMNLDLDVIE